MTLPSLPVQSDIDLIPAQILGVTMNCDGSKHEETRFEGRERESSFDWKSERQAVEVERSGRRKRDVSLRC